MQDVTAHLDQLAGRQGQALEQLRQSLSNSLADNELVVQVSAGCSIAVCVALGTCGLQPQVTEISQAVSLFRHSGSLM